MYITWVEHKINTPLQKLDWWQEERKGGRHKIFFTPLRPFFSDADEAESLRYHESKKKYIFKFIGDLNKMQCTGFICPQHKMLFQNFGKGVLMPLLRTSLCPKNASSRLSANVERENGSQDSSHFDNRPSWVHARSNTVSIPRETESNLQTWNSDPNASGSRTWPKEEIEQSIDLRVDGIPDDETFKDEQYMQRIAEQVQKNL